MGRPGGHRLHRRPRDRRNARPQRPAPRPLHRHQGRSGRAGLRGRRPRSSRRRHSQEGPPAARPHVPGRYRAAAHHLRRRDQEAAGRAASLTATGSRSSRSRIDQLPEPSRVIASNPETLLRRQRAYGYSEEDLQHSARPHGRQGRGADRLHGHRCAAGLPLRPPAAAVQLLQAALRAGHQSAHRSHPRRAGDVAHQLHRHRAQHPRRGAGELPHAQAAASHPDQPRSGKAAPRLFRRFAGHHAAGAVPRRRRRSGPASTRSTI